MREYDWHLRNLAGIRIHLERKMGKDLSPAVSDLLDSVQILIDYFSGLVPMDLSWDGEAIPRPANFLSRKKDEISRIPNQK